MTTRERSIFAPLIVMTLLLGVYPSLIIDIICPSVAHMLGGFETAVADFHATNQVASSGDN